MVRTYFGLPGSGKTTKLTQIAYKVSRQIDNPRKRSKYLYIVGNVPLRGIPHYYQIDFKSIGKIGYPGALILIDEATLEADSRKWGMASDSMINYILLHRHWQNDMFYFAQIWNRVDKTIRDITEEVVYLHKSVFFPSFTRETRIRYGVMIPQVGADKPGEIIMGYLQPSRIAKLLEKRFFRPRYYRYFDTLTRPALPLFECAELSPVPVSENDSPEV